jgi:mannobiose 2-epimerase
MGESRQLLSRDGRVLAGNLGNPWKGIYHTGRALSECVRRLDALL